jgi:UDP-N-acetyl-D-mannosaminuronic acid dehydrogenase
MNITVVGMGYVGIPVAALFADVPDLFVTGIQRRTSRSGWKIDHLNQGLNPIGGDEPGLDELVKRVVTHGKLHVTDNRSSYKTADAILITVQTPVDQDHNPRYESLTEVLHDIGQNLKPGALISLESTVAPGTTNYLAKPILEQESGLKAGIDFHLVFSYERVMVGRLLHNLTQYDRIIGGITLQSTQKGIDLYRHIVQANLHSTDALTAEVSKVTENTYRDVNIAFANEIALICESLGVNTYDVRKFVNSLPNDTTNPDANPYRNMHKPGPGVGGHCLPKDPWLLKYGLDTYGKISVDPQVILASRQQNDYMPHHMKTLLLDALAERKLRPENTNAVILGFAFLENSDDERNTPTMPLYHLLEKDLNELIIHDPHIKQYENYPITTDLDKVLKNKDAVILVTKHREYYELTLDQLKHTLRTPIIIDGRNVWDRHKALEKGFTFRGVGLPRN